MHCYDVLNIFLCPSPMEERTKNDQYQGRSWTWRLKLKVTQTQISVSPFLWFLCVFFQILALSFLYFILIVSSVKSSLRNHAPSFIGQARQSFSSNYHPAHCKMQMHTTVSQQSLQIATKWSMQIGAMYVMHTTHTLPGGEISPPLKTYLFLKELWWFSLSLLNYHSPQPNKLSLQKYNWSPCTLIS